MKTGIKVLGAVCGLFIIIGIILVVMGLAFGGGINDDPTEEVTLPAEGEFDKISVDISSANVIIKRSTDDKSYAVCDSSDKLKYELNVEGGVLSLTEIDNRKWYDHIGIFFRSRDAVIYLAGDSYDALTIKVSSGNIYFDEDIVFTDAEMNTSSGNIRITGLFAESLEVKASSGNISLSKCSVNKSIQIDLSSGNVKLSEIIAASINAETSSGNIGIYDSTLTEIMQIKISSGNIKIEDTYSTEKTAIESSSGNVVFERFDSKEIDIDVNSGNVKGTLLTGKTFDVRTESGTSDYPENSNEGGTCKIRTESGNVNITIAE